jgi:hypothetical protein
MDTKHSQKDCAFCSYMCVLVGLGSHSKMLLASTYVATAPIEGLKNWAIRQQELGSVVRKIPAQGLPRHNHRRYSNNRCASISNLPTPLMQHQEKYKSSHWLACKRVCTRYHVGRGVEGVEGVGVKHSFTHIHALQRGAPATAEVVVLKVQQHGTLCFVRRAARVQRQPQTEQANVAQVREVPAAQAPRESNNKRDKRHNVKAQRRGVVSGAMMRHDMLLVLGDLEWIPATLTHPIQRVEMGGPSTLGRCMHLGGGGAPQSKSKLR